jgi:hypothetical protein
MENNMPPVPGFVRQRNFINALDAAFHMQLTNLSIDLVPIPPGVVHAD